MSNNTPPRACLADFGFMTMSFDLMRPLSCSAQLEGGTSMYMAPELLVPSKFGFTESVPTQKSDIYAFGLIIYQVHNQGRDICHVLTSFRSSLVPERSHFLAFAWWKWQ